MKVGRDPFVECGSGHVRVCFKTIASFSERRSMSSFVTFVAEMWPRLPI